MTPRELLESAEQVAGKARVNGRWERLLKIGNQYYPKRRVNKLRLRLFADAPVTIYDSRIEIEGPKYRIEMYPVDTKDIRWEG